MKPDWDKLMKNFNKSKRGKTGLVADVDCTGEGKPLCEEHGVKGFPTIKWGDPSSLEAYEGGRDYESMKKFAMEKLKPICGLNHLDLCSEEKKAEIAKIQAIDPEELKTMVEEKEKEIKDAEDTFKEEVEKLQATYKELQDKKKEKADEIKNSDLGLMKAVKAASKKGKEEL